ncbi:MAG TPA: FHA domain-containing protein [Spirochaetota bacterium]|mgnify:CR=1 FL=1|nr:FHA domain-containing protein [Spirochaetota bacterium]HPI90986.1 FHA domain-containing protein [Spirochaetota bacterium]HPR49450.1 FHA domain-containing protein [Spirochaetota bacterium]
MTNKDTVKIEKRKLQSSGKLINRAVLVILSKKHFGKSFILNKSVNIIGRRNDCDIRISDPLISNRHCRIIYTEDGRFQLDDLESTNSTYLNNKVLKKPAVLTYGDRIVAGNTIMRFFYEEQFEIKK